MHKSLHKKPHERNELQDQGDLTEQVQDQFLPYPNSDALTVLIEPPWTCEHTVPTKAIPMDPLKEFLPLQQKQFGGGVKDGLKVHDFY